MLKGDDTYLAVHDTIYLDIQRKLLWKISEFDWVWRQRTFGESFSNPVSMTPMEWAITELDDTIGS